MSLRELQNAMRASPGIKLWPAGLQKRVGAHLVLQTLPADLAQPGPTPSAASGSLKFGHGPNTCPTIAVTYRLRSCPAHLMSPSWAWPNPNHVRRSTDVWQGRPTDR